MSDNGWEKDFYKLSDDLRECAVNAVTTVLEKKSWEVFRYLEGATPRRTGGLVSSLKREEVDKEGKVGYRILYDGYDDRGQAYQVIANALNRGYIANNFVMIPGRHFQDHAVTLLKGTDRAINEEWEKRINARTSKEE